jgi:RNA polymerase subunit RPABC4/transcription elongation factor Spt4
MKIEKVIGNIGDLIVTEIQKSMIAKKTTEKEKEPFDTLRGIKKAVFSLEDLNEVLENRKNFVLKNPKVKLNEFFIFGQFLLNEEGEVRTIYKGKNKRVIIEGRPDVERVENLLKIEGGFWLDCNEFSIPKSGSICPICQNELTINDVNNCVNISDEFYHFDCYKNKQKDDEISDFKQNVIAHVYDSSEYGIKILANDCESREFLTDKPMILLRTPEGDIKLGWNEREKISIEWQENYKPFNIKLLFNIFKIDIRKHRAVLVKNYEEAKLYLHKVRENVKIAS